MLEFKIDKQEIKNILKGLGTLIFYLISSIFEALPLELLNVDISKLSTNFKLIYSVIYQIVIILTIIYIYRETLKEQWSDFKKNHKKYFDSYFRYWLLILVLMLISNSLINFFIPDSIPANEEAIRQVFKFSPLYMYISAVVIAPILEELVLRLGFSYIFKTDTFFIILSGLMFGSLHVFPSAEQFIEFLYIIPYSIPGFIFAYILTKNKNIYSTIGLHFIHNGVLMSIQFLVLLFS